MQVTVHGEKIEVLVSESGMFHDKGMKNYSKTLKGLEKKLNENPTIAKNAPPIRVENISTHLQGRVTGRSSANYYYSYRVRWDNGKTSVLRATSLRKPTTQEQRDQIEQLKTARDAAEEVLNAAEEALEDFENQFEVFQELKDRFGVN